MNEKDDLYNTAVDLGFGSLGEFESELHGSRIRTEEEIRDALKRMCDTVWNGANAKQPFWHIPIDPIRDVDCILYDAFTELKRYRAIFGPLSAAAPRTEVSES